MTDKKIGASEIGLDPSGGNEKDLFRWWLASFLFGKRITQGIARRTYDVFQKAGLTTPDKIIDAGWHALVKKLGEGGYTRYDESTARRLIENSRKLKDEYGGRITNIFAAADSLSDLKQRLLEFNGVGPKTLEIFLRDISDPMSLTGGHRRRGKAA